MLIYFIYATKNYGNLSGEPQMESSYKRLWILLIEKYIKKSELRKLTGLSAGTITRLNKNKPVFLSMLFRK
jgi:hypothetical protein